MGRESFCGLFMWQNSCPFINISIGVAKSFEFFSLTFLWKIYFQLPLKWIKAKVKRHIRNYYHFLLFFSPYKLFSIKKVSDFVNFALQYVTHKLTPEPVRKENMVVQTFPHCCTKSYLLELKVWIFRKSWKLFKLYQLNAFNEQSHSFTC